MQNSILLHMSHIFLFCIFEVWTSWGFDGSGGPTPTSAS